MLKVLVTAIALLVASSAGAQDVDAKTVEQWWDAHYVCRIGELRDGTPATDQVSDQNCRDRKRLNDLLTANGYTWDAGELEWRKSDDRGATTLH